jgi:hypothetical protein
MPHLASMGKTMGTLCMSRVIDIRRCKSDDHTRWGGEGLQVRVASGPGSPLDKLLAAVYVVGCAG